MLQIDGQSIKFVDRKLWKRDSFDEKLSFEKKVFEPSKVSSVVDESCRPKVRRKCPIEIEYPRKRRILKRPKRFKTYYSDRKPLSIPCFSFPRLGEPFPFRGRQTLCKYYHNNEILNEQLLRIKSAYTIQEFEKLFRDQKRHSQGFSKSARSVEPYYDLEEVLSPSKLFANETCLCTKDIYQLVDERHLKPSAAAIKSPTCKRSVDEFVQFASECYDKCINIYQENLDDCNRKADIIERQSLHSQSGSSGKRSLKPREINDLPLTHQINKLSLSINIDNYHQFKENSPDLLKSAGQSALLRSHCRQQAMSCNDTNNNCTESTNQLTDPPEIVFSDYSTNQSIQGEHTSKDFSDSNSATDKNCLTIPPENFYSSEARPP